MTTRVADMTKEEVFEKFKDLPLTFDHYYKYTFTFVGRNEEYTVIADVGGNSEDIYRQEVSADCTETLGTLEPYSVVVKLKGGGVVFSWYGY